MQMVVQRMMIMMDVMVIGNSFFLFFSFSFSFFFCIVLRDDLIR